MSSAGKISSSPINTKMSTYRFVLSALVAATTLISSAHAHMVLTNPVPYGKPQTNPLKGDGSDYPCQQARGVYDPPSTKNEYTTGGEIDVAFGGSASHGGGSCQFAITTEKQPTLDTVWQVIYSIEGGCPLKGDDTPVNTGSDNFTVPIPSSVAAGDYTFAWTWYNRVGNRELYMNCAPITIKPGGSTKRAVEARKAHPFVPKLEKRDNSTMPDLWLANICNQKCTTGQGHNAIFPSPGAYTTGYASKSMEIETCTCARSEIAATQASAVAGSGAAPTGSASSGSSGSDSSGSSGSGSSGSVATSAASVAATSAAASSGGGAAILSTAVATETVVSTAAAAAATGSSSSSGSTGSSDMSGSSSSSSNTTSSSGTCTGTLQCSSDGTQFGLCGGPSVIYQAVAPGTKCADGNIVAA